MKIKNIEGLSACDLQEAVKEGGRFVFYPYTISTFVLTFKRTSGVYLVRKHQSRVVKGLGYTLLTLILGWWGIPYGPRYTLESIRVNLQGGKDVTDDVMSVVAGYALYDEYVRNKQ
jgi:hypothetical protein